MYNVFINILKKVFEAYHASMYLTNDTGNMLTLLDAKVCGRDSPLRIQQPDLDGLDGV